MRKEKGGGEGRQADEQSGGEMGHQTSALPAGVYYPAPPRPGSAPPLPDSGHAGPLNSWEKGRWKGKFRGLCPEAEGWGPGEQTPGSRRGREQRARTTAPPLYPPLTRASGEDRSLLRALGGGGGRVGMGVRRGDDGTRIRGSHRHWGRRRF